MTDTPDGRPENYGRLLQQASSSMGQELGRFAARYGLTEVQMAVINFMSSQPGGQVPQHAIEAEFHIRRSTVTVTLQRMEARGLLTRSQAADDARRKIVRLTARATRDVEAIHHYIDHEQREFERRFSPTQIDDFKAALAFFGRVHDDEEADRDMAGLDESQDTNVGTGERGKAPSPATTTTTTTGPTTIPPTRKRECAADVDQLPPR